MKKPKSFWTKRQINLLRRILREYKQPSGQMNWKRAFTEHPEWLGILDKSIHTVRKYGALFQHRPKSTYRKMMTSLYAIQWNRANRQAYLQNLTASVGSRRRLVRLKTELGWPFKHAVHEGILLIYQKMFPQRTGKS